MEAAIIFNLYEMMGVSHGRASITVLREGNEIQIYASFWPTTRNCISAQHCCMHVCDSHN